MQTNIGEKIRHLRIHKQLSQTELVDGICSVAYLSKVENGKAKPSKAFLQQVAERLNVSFDMIDNPSSDNFQQKLETSLVSIEAEKRSLTPEDESLFKMALIEFVPPLLLIRVITVLLKEYLAKDHIKEAEYVFQKFINLIDTSTNFTPEDQLEKNIYFRFHKVLGMFFYIKNNFNKAEYHFLMAERYIDNPHDLKSGEIYYKISLVKQRLIEDKTLALYYSEKAYEIFKQENDLNNLVKTLITMGVQYHFAAQYESSLRVLNEAAHYLETATIDNENSLFSMTHYNIGRVYQKTAEYEKALQYYNGCLEFLLEERGKVYILKAILEIKLHLKQWEEVKRLLDEALYLTQKYEMISIEVDLQWIKAKVFKQRGDELNYEKYIKQAIEMAEGNDYYLFVKRMGKELGDYYNENRFYKKAAKYYALALDNS